MIAWIAAAVGTRGSETSLVKRIHDKPHQVVGRSEKLAFYGLLSASAQVLRTFRRECFLYPSGFLEHVQVFRRLRDCCLAAVQVVTWMNTYNRWILTLRAIVQHS